MTPPSWWADTRRKEGNHRWSISLSVWVESKKAGRLSSSQLTFLTGREEFRISLSDSWNLSVRWTTPPSFLDSVSLRFNTPPILSWEVWMYKSVNKATQSALSLSKNLIIDDQWPQTVRQLSIQMDESLDWISFFKKQQIETTLAAAPTYRNPPERPSCWQVASFAWPISLSPFHFSVNLIKAKLWSRG